MVNPVYINAARPMLECDATDKAPELVYEFRDVIAATRRADDSSQPKLIASITVRRATGTEARFHVYVEATDDSEAIVLTTTTPGRDPGAPHPARKLRGRIVDYAARAAALLGELAR
jgi:hypothetical protein